MNGRKNRTFLTLAAVILSGATSGAPAQVAQQATKAEPPKPAFTEVDELRAAWNDMGRKIIAMAEDMPDAKYDYKPAQDTRSFRGLLLHVAGSNYYFIHPVAGRKMGDDGNDPDPGAYRSKASVVTFLKKSFADGSAVMQQQGEAGLKKEIRNEFTNQMEHARARWYAGVGHSAEHYGNLVTYYRVRGLVPPESRPKK